MNIGTFVLYAVIALRSKLQKLWKGGTNHARGTIPVIFLTQLPQLMRPFRCLVKKCVIRPLIAAHPSPALLQLSTDALPTVVYAN